MSLLPQIWRHRVGDYRTAQSVLSGANLVYSYYSRRNTGSSTRRRSIAAEGDIGGLYDMPEIPLGSGVAEPGIIGAVGNVIAGAVVSAVDGRQTTGSGPADFEEGGVFADPVEGWVYNGEPWDPYNTGDPELDQEESEVPPIAFIPPTAGQGEPDPYEPEPGSQTEEDEPMPSFWDFVNPIIDVAQGQSPGGSPYTSNYVAATPPGAITNAPVTINPRTGRPVCKRRRRRRLLTESDFNDLMRIATLPNKQNVTVALAKAVGRR